MSEIFIFQNKFHNFFSLKNQLKKHVVSYFCNLQLQYTNKRDSQTCVLPSINYKYQMKWKTIKDILLSYI
jgi:hypothetical protein